MRNEDRSMGQLLALLAMYGVAVIVAGALFKLGWNMF